VNITTEMEYIHIDKDVIIKRVAVFQYWIYPGKQMASVCVPLKDDYNMGRLLDWKGLSCVGCGNIIEVVGYKPVYHTWLDLAVKVEYKQSNPSPRNPYTLWYWIKHPFWIIKDKITWKWITWRLRVHNRMERK